jgi:hypothetical protein
MVKSPNKNVKRLYIKQSVNLSSLVLHKNSKLFFLLPQNKDTTNPIIFINKAWRQVSQSTIVNCWIKVDILDNKNINYSIDLNNFELDIFFKEEIQKVTADYIKTLEKYRKDYVELEEVDHFYFIMLIKFIY